MLNKVPKVARILIVLEMVRVPCMKRSVCLAENRCFLCMFFPISTQKQAPHIQSKKKKMTRSLLFNKNFYLKRFNLRMIKEVQIKFCPYSNNYINKGTRDFLDRCQQPKAKSTNPKCVVKCEMVSKEEILPQVVIKFEDGRELNYENSSYLPATSFMEAIYFKKKKIKRWYEKANIDFYDTEEEDINGTPEDEGGKKKKKGKK